MWSTVIFLHCHCYVNWRWRLAGEFSENIWGLTSHNFSDKISQLKRITVLVPICKQINRRKCFPFASAVDRNIVEPCIICVYISSLFLEEYTIKFILKSNLSVNRHLFLKMLFIRTCRLKIDSIYGQSEALG